MNLRYLHYSYIFLVFGGLLPMLVNGPSDFRDYVSDRSQLLNFIYLLVALIYLSIFIITMRISISSLSCMKAPILLSLLALLSFFWSSVPFRSFVIGFFVFSQIIIAVYILRDLRFEEFFRAVFFISTFLGVISVLFILFAPSYGKMTFVFPGAWQGVFIHKNVFGRFAVFYLLTSLVYFKYHKDSLSIFSIILSLILVVGSGSATALILLFFVILVYFFSSYRRLLKSLVFLGCLLSFLIYSFFDQVTLFIADFFGKSITLSGRTDIWISVFDAIMEKPLAGFGMGGFWSTDISDSIRTDLNWFVPHAHNGVLELALQLGILGVLLFLFSVINFAILSLDTLRFKIKYKEWFFLYLVFFVGYGLGEANYLRPNSFVHLFFLIGYLYMSLNKISVKKRRGYG